MLAHCQLEAADEARCGEPRIQRQITTRKEYSTFVIPGEGACQAVALCEGLKEISGSHAENVRTFGD